MTGDKKYPDLANPGLFSCYLLWHRLVLLIFGLYLARRNTQMKHNDARDSKSTAENQSFIIYFSFSSLAPPYKFPGPEVPDYAPIPDRYRPISDIFSFVFARPLPQRPLPRLGTKSAS
jgi:hypothetical protein